ncbi:phage protein [Streptococcus dysgalactiae]|nr:phage protein [Streptococcus dysgalactiae]
MIVGQCYILVVDKYNFDKGKDVEIYRIISNTKADIYKVNKYNYQSVITTEREPSVPQARPPEPPTAMGLYQSITIDGLPIARVICNNQIIWSQSAEPQEAYNITAYVDANVSKLNDYAVIDYNQDFATYGGCLASS